MLMNFWIFAKIVLVYLVNNKVLCSFDVNTDVSFELFTNERSLDDHQKLTNDIERSNQINVTFSPNRPTRIFVHGYMSSRKTFLRYAEAYRNRGDYNFIAVNWLKGSVTINYYRARHRIERVGIALAAFIDYLVEFKNLNLTDLVVVGHSLGAHVAGIAGKNVQSGKIEIIVGLDPALPLFTLSKVHGRLAYTDANYVQVIHTNGKQASILNPIGDADFYPNFGKIQPGCSQGITGWFSRKKCSHSRAHKLYIESLNTNSTFVSTKCASYEEIKEKVCTPTGETAKMGGDEYLKMKPKGIYYIKTNSEPPYQI